MTPIPLSQVYEDDLPVNYNITSQCSTWFEAGTQISQWSTPSYAKCGTVQTKKIYEETVGAKKEKKLSNRFSRDFKIPRNYVYSLGGRPSLSLKDEQFI